MKEPHDDNDAEVVQDIEEGAVENGNSHDNDEARPTPSTITTALRRNSSRVQWSTKTPSFSSARKRSMSGSIRISNSHLFEDWNDNDNNKPTASSSTSADRWRPWIAWSRGRWLQTAVGCTSSSIVLVVRLLLDHQPLAYLIHSIVVFLDMTLIHLFTRNNWLSVSGELVTIACFLAFHFTKETVFELLETTLIAVLCSFHLIASRSKALDQRQKLQGQVRSLKRRGSVLLHNMELVHQELLKEEEEETFLEQNNVNNDEQERPEKNDNNKNVNEQDDENHSINTVPAGDYYDDDSIFDDEQQVEHLTGELLHVCRYQEHPQSANSKDQHYARTVSERLHSWLVPFSSLPPSSQQQCTRVQWWSHTFFEQFCKYNHTLYVRICV